MHTTDELRSKDIRVGFLRTAVLLPVVLLLAAGAQAQLSRKSEEHVEQKTRRIVVSIPDRELALIEDGEVKKVFPVAVGKESTPSPSGSFRIVNRVTRPTYYHKGKVIPPGPANPVGTRWMGLSKRGYGIHGTNVPSSIGKAASHGCIRMARADLEQLFALVQAGDAVEIRSMTEVFGKRRGQALRSVGRNHAREDHAMGIEKGCLQHRVLEPGRAEAGALERLQTKVGDQLGGPLLGGGPLLLFYVLFFDRGGSGWWIVTAITMIVVGFVLLVLRGGTERDPFDDGTRV